MEKKLAQSILVQYCGDCKATDFYSDPSAEASYQKLIRLIRIKPCYKIPGIPTINIHDKIMKVYDIRDGIHLRAFMLEAWKEGTKGMSRFRMQSTQEKRYIEAKEWVNGVLEKVNKQFIPDSAVEAANTEEKRAELLKDFDPDDLLVRDRDGHNMIVFEDWSNLTGEEDTLKAKNKMKSMLSHIREYEEGIDKQEAFILTRECTVEYYIKHGNKNLKDADF